MERIEFDADEIAAADCWHAGQSSMLYAVASTGSLSRGTIRPTAYDGARMMDDQWLAHLAGELESEVNACITAVRIGDPFADEHTGALHSIAEKCRAAIARLGAEP